ncbi:MAG TPA: CHASE2 domain-containing protein [Gammaproteobacteria bacterium]|nr:CHASE2 domain-containing protein [Gammaproteobacteria bacterium]
MLRNFLRRAMASIDAAMARLGLAFVAGWGHIEKGYRRPYARLTLLLGFWFYPLFAVLALAWLAWDWSGPRNLAAAENAIFDQVISWRLTEPKPSGKVVIVEIDDCSINYYRAKGEGGWPWSRARQADLLDALDRAGVRAVGFDIQFADPSASDPQSDSILEAMAEGGDGRFVFASTRLNQDYDSDSSLHVSQAPSAFPLVAHPDDDPTVALLLPYGKAMQKNSALVNVTRNVDGVIRDVPLRERAGDWAIPSLALRLATGPDPAKMARYPASIRIDWRSRSRLPDVSAANLLAGKRICGNSAVAPPKLKGATVLIGYTAAGLNDAKPTPVSATMPGVAIEAEAVEALLTRHWIWMPPPWFKYVIAALLVLLTGYAFFRGEPAWELDQIFVAGNLVLLLVAYIGVTYFAVFLDIFAAVGFVALCFAVCRSYAHTQRGYAVGNDDYRQGFEPELHPWLAMVRLRFVPDPGIEARALDRRLREFRRRLRRFLYRGTDAVALDCVVEYDTWFWDSMIDVTVLLWAGTDRAAVVARAERELDALHAYLAGMDSELPDDGSVRIACVITCATDERDSAATARTRVSAALGEVLREPIETPLATRNVFVSSGT